jgi:TonB family protein
MSWRMLWDNFVTYGMQIGLLIGLAAFVPTLLRLRMPRARLAYWHILLTVCLLLPLMAPRKQETIYASTPTATALPTPMPMPASPKRAIPRSQVAFALIAAGMMARLVWLGVGFWKLRQYRLNSRPLEPALSWGVEADLRISADVSSPVTFGFRKPVVLLPAHFPELAPEMQDAVLCHEILHVRRGDWLFTLGEELVRCVFWFHPAIWWLLGEIGLAREQAVDQEAIELTKSRDGYLDALLAIAGANPQMDVAPAPLFLRKRHLKQRVVSIMKEVRMSKTRRVSALAAGLGFLAAACWVVTMALPLAAQPTVVNDAPGVTVDLGGSSVLHRTGVTYPIGAMRAHISGIVTVEASLDSAGNVIDARVVSGPPELRRNALQSVLQWHFSMDNASLTRRINIDFKAPAELPERPAGVMGGTVVSVVGGVPGGVAGGTTSGVREGVLGGVIGSGPSVGYAITQPIFAGKVLGSIMISGLSEQAKNDLLSRLPVHEGDIMADDSFDKVVKVVRDYDEHLNVGRMLPRGSSDRVGITIIAPGGGMAASPMSTASVPPPADGTKRITIGGNVQQAKLISQPAPVYPPLAKQARISGVVHLQVVIAKDGTVKDIALISGHPLLVPPSFEAVKNWRYQPTLLNGDPVEVLTQVDVNYTLSDQQ